MHYDLHAWLFKDNPHGMFSATNPKVNCKGYTFSLLEKPTRMMHGPSGLQSIPLAQQNGAFGQSLFATKQLRLNVRYWR